MNDRDAERIRKLLALANSPNEHEAAAAAKKAHELLVLHNLDLQQVLDRPPTDYGEELCDKRTFKRTEDDFVDRIVMAHFFVEMYTSRKKGPLYRQNRSIPTWYETHTYMVGTKANIQIAGYVRSFLIATFYKLWLDYRRDSGCAAKEQRSYYRGLELGLQAKLDSQRKTIETGRGLVLVEDPQLAKIMAAKNLRSGKSRNIQFGQSFYSGKEDGEKIEVRRGITADPKQTQLSIGPKKRD